MLEAKTKANENLYDFVAPYFDVLSGGRRNREKETAFCDSLFSEHLSIEHRARILECGCATGEFIALMKSRGWHIDGVDTAGKMLEIAQTKNPSSHFYPTLESAPRQDEYDVILALNGFGAFLLGNRNLEMFFKDVARVSPKFLVFDIRNYAVYRPTDQVFPHTEVIETNRMAITFTLQEHAKYDTMHTWKHRYSVLDKETLNTHLFNGTLTMHFHSIEDVRNAAEKYFSIEECWGDYDFSPFSKESPRWIAILTPRDA